MNLWQILSTYTEQLPFACLVTGKVIRKPEITRIIEQLIIVALGAFLALYVNSKVLERDFENMKREIIANKDYVDKAIARRTEQIARERQEVIQRLDRIEQHLLNRKK